MIKQILLVGIGGGIGSIFRFLVSLFVDRYFESFFPYATFIVNILGCFLIGLFIGFLNLENPQYARFLLITGFCGGFTTFSTFASENLTLIQSQQYVAALLYIFGSIALGVLAVGLGLLVGKQLHFN